MTRRIQHALVALLAGLLFGAGLALGGMTQPRKVIGFLDFGGAWDPSLAFVMASALAIHVLAYRVIRGSAAPLFADEFVVPKLRQLDWRLLSGSAVFGIGWGLAGYCPGPAIVSLGAGSAQALIFIPALFLGMLGADKLVQLIDHHPRSGPSGLAPRVQP